MRSSRGGGALGIGIGVALAVFACAVLVVATREWFKGDDFFFLAHVQTHPPWSWFDLDHVLTQRWWVFYRPVGMESFYFVGWSLFGLHYPGFVALALVVTLITGIFVQRIAVALGFDARIASLAAALAVTRPPQAHVLYDAYSFQYTAVLFFYALAAAAFCESLRRRPTVYQAVSCAALALGLFCNELALTLPGVLGLLSLACEARTSPVHALLRALRRVLPQLAVVAGYLSFRFGLLPPAELPSLYSYYVGSNLYVNAWALLLEALGGPAGALGTVVITAGIAGIAVWRGADARPAFRWLAGVHALCAVWALVAVLPYAPLWFGTQTRWAVPAAIPLALLLGAYAELAWRTLGRCWPRAVSLALCVLLLASLPYGTLLERAQQPKGREPQRLLEIVRAHAIDDATTRFVILHGRLGAAAPATARSFRWSISSGKDFITATRPGLAEVAFLDLSSPPPPRFWPSGRCVYLVLEPGGRIAVARRTWLDAKLPVPLAERCTAADG